MQDKTLSRPTLEAYLDCARAAAMAAGRHALRQSQRRREVTQRFAHDLKLKLDRECQDVAEKIIRRRYPRHAMLGEEDTQATSLAGEPTWIIDPIDGTVNFFHGLHLWCSSVALRVQGRIVAGAVYAPELRACYMARSGAPALCNGRPIAVSDTARLAQAMVATGINKDRCGQRSVADLLCALSARTQKLRVMGSAALDLCLVASGKIDGYFESGIYLWDMAAASLIVQQAGGRCTILDQDAQHRVACVASNARLHGALKRCLRQHALKLPGRGA